jgi:hypothetical protein
MTNGTVPAPTMDCMTASCHGTGGAGGAFLFAGFVATTAGGTTGAPGIEVRVYDNGAGKGYSAYTDTNGYFWMLPPNGGTTGPYNAGIRCATGTGLMTAQQTAIDCDNSSCHGGGQGNIHL